MKSDCLCCVALPCCLFDLASFFLPSHLSLRHVCTCEESKHPHFAGVHVHVSHCNPKSRQSCLTCAAIVTPLSRLVFSSQALEIRGKHFPLDSCTCIYMHKLMYSYYVVSILMDLVQHQGSHYTQQDQYLFVLELEVVSCLA